MNSSSSDVFARRSPLDESRLVLAPTAIDADASQKRRVLVVVIRVNVFSGTARTLRSHRFDLVIAVFVRLTRTSLNGDPGGPTNGKGLGDRLRELGAQRLRQEEAHDPEEGRVRPEDDHGQPLLR